MQLTAGYAANRTDAVRQVGFGQSVHAQLDKPSKVLGSKTTLNQSCPCLQTKGNGWACSPKPLSCAYWYSFKTFSPVWTPGLIPLQRTNSRCGEPE
jgi:hypothetical protein